MIGASWLLLHEYLEGRAQIEKDTRQTARALAQAIDNQILRVEALAHGLATASSLAHGDLAGFHSQARETLKRAKLAVSVVLINRGGWQVLNTLKEFGEPLPYAGSPELVRRVFETAQPVVSDVYMAAVMRRPIMTVAVPVFVGGEVTYVLIAPILPDKFNSIFKAQGLPADWVATVLDSTGTIFGRTHAPDEFVGKKAAAEFTSKYVETDESVFEAVDENGNAVLSVYTRSPVTRWGVAIDIPKARIESTLTRSLSLLALGVAGLFAAGLALAWFMAARISNSIRGLVAPALSLGAGAPVALPPVAVKEAAEVAEAIAHAARLLEERSAALRHANSQIDFLIRHSPANIAVFDRNMRYLAASLRWSSNFGLDGGDLIGKCHYDVVPDLPETWKEAHRRGLAGETVMAEAAPWVRSDGSVKFCNWEVWPWRDERGAVGGIVITDEDVTERRATEERVRASEEKYRTLFTNMSEGFALGEPIFDDEGRPVDYRLLEVNDAFYEQTSIPRGIEGRPLREALPQLEPIWTDRYAAAALDGQSAWIESYNADTRRYYDAYCFCPSPGRFAILFRDVTERKQAEQALLDSRQSLALAMRAGGSAAWELDVASSRIIPVDDVLYAMVGYEIEELDQLADWISRIHAEDQDAVIRNLAEIIDGRSDSFRQEYRLRRKDGNWHWLLSQAVAVERDAQGRATRLIGTNTDIHARKRTEERLKDNEEKYRALFTNMAEGFVLGEPILDPAGRPIDLRYLEVNEAFYLHTGMPRGITERPLREHLPQVEQEWIDRYAAVALTGRDDSFERYNADTDRYYDVRAFSPTPGRFAVLFRDVTDRKQAEKERERHQAELERRVEERTAEVVQLQKMEAIGQLTGGVAHDFNNLLQGLASCLFVLDRFVPEGTPRTLYETAMRSIESGARLTQSLLAFARRQTLQPEPIDVQTLFDNIVPLLERTLGGMIRIEFAVQPGTPAAQADRSQLESALLNLAINARDAMPSGGRLVLRAAPVIGACEASAQLEPGEYVAISVEDTGTGMDEATRARVFEPFFTTKDFGKGSGLGLSMVHGMAAQAGGCVTIDSEPGRGTTVTLFLPQAQAPEKEAPETPAVVESGDGSVVLLVDDNELMRDALSITLEAQGYRVLTAASGAAALSILRDTGRIDALVTDYAMPGMSGASLVGEARRLIPALPVLLITGYAEKLDDTDGIALLHKPFRTEDLLASVASMLKGGAPGGASARGAPGRDPGRE